MSLARIVLASLGLALLVALAVAVKAPVTLKMSHVPHLHKAPFAARVAHAKQRISRLAPLSGIATPPSQVPIDGAVAIYGEYFVKVGLGSPADQLQLQVDTGSTDLLVYGIGCDGCPSEADRYNFGASRTAKPQPCSGGKYQCASCYNSSICAFDDGYGDGSDVTGFVLQDSFTFDGLSAKSTVSMGAIMHSTSNFEPLNVDGIFGLAYPSTSAWGANSPLIDFMSQNGYYAAFSMCLHNDTGSSLTIGLNAHSNNNIVWSPRFFSQAYYTVQLESIQVGGKALKVDKKTINGQYGALVDSGTTLIILPNKVFSALETAIKAVCSSYQLPGVCNVPSDQDIFSGACFDMTPTDISNFPTFGVKMSGIDAVQTITSVKYLVHQGNQLCLGIVPSGDQAVTILGDTFMRGFYIVFDQASNSIGFADQSQCPQ